MSGTAKSNLNKSGNPTRDKQPQDWLITERVLVTLQHPNLAELNWLAQVSDEAGHCLIPFFVYYFNCSYLNYS